MAVELVLYALAKTATARRLAAPAAAAAALPNVLIASEGPFPVGYVPTGRASTTVIMLTDLMPGGDITPDLALGPGNAWDYLAPNAA
jgi:hypothetical protein